MSFSGTLCGSAQSQLVPAPTPTSLDWERQGGIPGMPWEGSGHHAGHIGSQMESLSFTRTPSPASIPDPGGEALSFWRTGSHHLMLVRPMVIARGSDGQTILLPSLPLLLSYLAPPQTPESACMVK